MVQYHKVSEHDLYGIMIYTGRNPQRLRRHKLVFVDMDSIAEKTGMTRQQLIYIAGFDTGVSEAIGTIIFPGGGKVKVIHSKQVPALFQLLNVVTNSENEMVKAAKIMVTHAIAVAPKEEGELDA